jgi:hypothetical protein
VVVGYREEIREGKGVVAVVVVLGGGLALVVVVVVLGVLALVGVPDEVLVHYEDGVEPPLELELGVVVRCFVVLVRVNIPPNQ